MYEIIFFLLIGVLAGILSGFFGIGGGIIIVPALMFICGFTQLKAQGTSLAVLLPPVGVLAFLQYYKEGNVDIKASIIICIAVIIGSMFGGKFAHDIPPDILQKGFAVLMMLVGLKMFLSK